MILRKMLVVVAIISTTVQWIAIANAATPLSVLGVPESPTARVTDLKGMLNADQKSQLEGQLIAIEKTGRAQIVVLILPSTKSEPIDKFGLRLANTWKITAVRLNSRLNRCKS